MAIKGCGGILKVDTNVVAEVKDWSASESGSEVDTSVLGNCNTQAEVSNVTTNVTINVFYDPADAAQTALTVGAIVALELYPVDDQSGAKYYTSTSAVVLSREFSGNHADMLPRSYTLKCNDGLTENTVV